jgi:hypothetical protein
LLTRNDQVVNRFCDPDYPVDNGSIFALVTGDAFEPIGAERAHRAESKAKENGKAVLTEAERHDALMRRKTRGRVKGAPSKSIPILGRMLKEDVLYLVRVYFPNPGDIAKAKEMIEVAA